MLPPEFALLDNYPDAAVLSCSFLKEDIFESISFDFPEVPGTLVELSAIIPGYIEPWLWLVLFTREWFFDGALPELFKPTFLTVFIYSLFIL